MAMQSHLVYIYFVAFFFVCVCMCFIICHMYISHLSFTVLFNKVIQSRSLQLPNVSSWSSKKRKPSNQQDIISDSSQLLPWLWQWQIMNKWIRIVLDSGILTYCSVFLNFIVLYDWESCVHTAQEKVCL